MGIVESLLQLKKIKQLICSDSSKYKTVKSAKIHEDPSFAGNLSLLSCPLYDPTCVMDENIPTDPEEVFTTDAAITYPWFELELKKPAKIMGIEFSHHLQLNSWHDVHISAGMTSTSAADGSTPSGLLTDLDLMAIFKGCNPCVVPQVGTVNYVTFSEPVVAKYILVQANWNIPKHFTLSEMKIIESNFFRKGNHFLY